MMSISVVLSSAGSGTVCALDDFITLFSPFRVQQEADRGSVAGAPPPLRQIHVQ